MNLASFTHPLPVRLTPFIGRKSDMEKVLELIQLPSVRLITILGAGGIGKTRLAIELAHVLRDRFQHGAVFIPLAKLSMIDEVLPAIAGTLGVQLSPGSDLQQAVLEYLADRQLLLVLDNFEHLLDEAALICEILISCPEVKVLVTSREKLNLEAETLYHLGGLQLPPRNNLDNAQDYGAVSLFLQKANQVKPGFSLDTANAPDVIKICHLVDGNPLGILLAAAWLEHFSPAEIGEEIRQSLDFLSLEMRDAEPRHFGMRAVFDSSFDRLEEHLRVVFRKLSVFRGGFDLTAAQAVAEADLRTLIALVDKSLLARDPNTGRYELHELLRQYATERLQASGDRENVLAAYTKYYITFVHQRERRLIGNLQTATLNEIEADFDNIRQAWTTAIQTRDYASIQTALPSLYAFCDMRSRFYEGETLFRVAREGLVPNLGEPSHPALALLFLSWFDMWTYIEQFETFDQITSQAQHCLEEAMAMRDSQAIAASLVLFGAIAEDRHDFRTALQSYKDGLSSYPALDDFYWVMMRIGLCHQALQEYAEAINTFQICLQRGKETGERVKTGWSLLNIGETLLLQGNPTEAEQNFEQAYTFFEEVGTTIGIIWCLYGLSRAAMALLNPARGRELVETARKLASQIHSASWIKKTDNLLHQIDPQLTQPSSKTIKQGDEAFSPRELEVLQLLKSDLNGPDIAERLVVSLNTVRYHTKNIYRKLGAGTRMEAIRRAKELGL
jgi:predicted ATPase/DNA-binding CsgD family transcriptional regulator